MNSFLILVTKRPAKGREMEGNKVIYKKLKTPGGWGIRI